MVWRHWSLTIITLLNAFAHAATRETCPCGFSVGKKNNSLLFTDVLETDFLHLTSTKNECWIPQSYNVTADGARGSFGKRATLDNVVCNPLKDEKSWSGAGKDGSDPGLQLWVGSEVQDGLVVMGEIVSKRKDIFFGSFRVGMKVTQRPGTCAGFFWYHDDEQEIDMEFLSSTANSSSNPVYLVMQSPASAQHGYNAAGTPTYDVAQLPFPSSSSNYHEYRFDWTPDRVAYYADSVLLHDLTLGYNLSSGSLFMNHWSNGNALWSRGPPLQDAVVTISYVKAYFNSSDAARSAEFEAVCGGRSACAVPDQTASMGASLETHFYAHGMCGEGREAGAGTAGSTSAQTSGGKAPLAPRETVPFAWAILEGTVLSSLLFLL